MVVKKKYTQGRTIIFLEVKNIEKKMFAEPEKTK